MELTDKELKYVLNEMHKILLTEDQQSDSMKKAMQLYMKTKGCSKEEADKFILFNAEKSGSHILSNDCFRDREAQYPWVNSQNDPAGINRIHKFIVDTGHLVIPDLGIFKEIS